MQSYDKFGILFYMTQIMTYESIEFCLKYKILDFINIVLKRLLNLEKEVLGLLYKNTNFKLVIGHGDLHKGNLI